MSETAGPMQDWNTGLKGIRPLPQGERCPKSVLPGARGVMFNMLDNPWILNTWSDGILRPLQSKGSAKNTADLQVLRQEGVATVLVHTLLIGDVRLAPLHAVGELGRHR